MSGQSDRRGFLRGLATLPLIGGGVTLIGNPTAAAVPVTPRLLDAYDQWLSFERSFLKWERFGPKGMDLGFEPQCSVVWQNRETGESFDHIPCNRVTGYGYGREGDSPSARAAVMLRAAGCDWRRA